MILCRPGLAEHDDVVALAVVVVGPDGAVGEDFEEGRNLALHDGGIAFVQRHPLGDETARVRCSLAHLKILLGVKRRRALHPRMNGVRRDDVELFPGGEDEIPRIVIDHVDAGIMDDIVVLLGEIGGRRRAE